MPIQKGSTVNFIMGFESTFNTLASAGFQLPVNTFGLSASRPKNSPATLTGTRNPAAPFDGNLIVAGPVVVPIDSAALPYWLKAMFGASTPSGSDPYTHEFKIADDMPSVSIETQFTDLATDKFDQFTGCKISSFGVSVGGDGELVGNIEVVGAGEALASSAFDASPTEVTLARISNFNAAITEGGGALANAKQFAINLNFGLDQDQYVIGGGGELGALPEGIIKVSGNIETLFEDSSLLDKAIASTETSLKLTATASASSIFELEIEELQYSRKSPILEGPTGMSVNLDFEGYYSAGSEASAIVARVTNAVASY